MLLDRLVCSIKDDALQCCLLVKPELTFKQHSRSHKPWKQSPKTINKLQRSTLQPKESDVHKITRCHGGEMRERTEGQKHKGGPYSTCHRCGKSGLAPVNCRRGGTKCHNCRKIGHLKGSAPRQATEAQHDRSSAQSFAE